jgi:hypothetical protein
LIRNVKESNPADKDHQPKCHGRVALNDAVVTLASNLAMAHERRVVFKPEWFDVSSDAAPETDEGVVGGAKA